MFDVSENATKALRMVREAKELSYDTETSGLDWRFNFPIGYVVGDGAQDVVYVPVRHGGGGNLPGVRLPQTAKDPIEIHPFEVELAKAFKERTGLTVGHNIIFDCHFSANAEIMLGRNLICTQNNEAMLDEYARTYSLDACAKRHGVQAKQGAELYAHIANIFGVPNDKTSMSRFWELAGDDPVAVDYAVGDGVSTYQLWESQRKRIEAEEMQFIHDIESRLIWTIFKMERRGIKVDMEYLQRLPALVAMQVEEAKNALPPGFNVRSGTQMKKYMEECGHTDWPTTEIGNPSFTEKWLKRKPEGRNIVKVRKWSNLVNSFVNPLIEEHSFNGRVHAHLNQLKSDDVGAVSGRLSCSSPNLQQIPKRDKEISKLFRRAFVADEGYTFYEGDYSQCLAAGTKVTIPSETKNIEDMQVGDWVYSYDADRNLTLKKVLWAGQTGVKPLFRVRWMGVNGQSEGYLDATGDHKIRMLDGSYKTVDELRMSPPVSRRPRRALRHHVLALRRDIPKPKDNKALRKYLHITGHDEAYSESRFVYCTLTGTNPEHVHHKNKNTLDNTPDNLEGVTWLEHSEKHRTRPDLTPELVAEVYRQQGSTRRTADCLDTTVKTVKKQLKKQEAVNNHVIFAIEELPGVHPVYCITVEDTHNFIANEISVSNCEPRMFAAYSKEPSLLQGYNMNPPKDMHAVVAELLGVEREPTGKRINMGIMTGMFPDTFAMHMEWPLGLATQKWNEWFEAFPRIKDFQNRATRLLRSTGYVVTILGRRCRLDNPRFAYRAVSKIIQGGNADLLKWFMLHLDLLFEQDGNHHDLLMTVHDAFQWQSKIDSPSKLTLDVILHELTRVQEPPFNLPIPFVVDVGSGSNWSQATFG